MNDFANLFSYVATFSVLIPTFYFILNRKKRDKVSMGMFVLLCTSIVTEISNEVYVAAGNLNSLIVNLYTLPEFIFISLLYASFLPRWNKLIYTTIALYTAFFIVNTIFIEDIKAMQDYSLVAESSIVIIYGLLHSFYLSKTIDHEPSIFQDGRFWITIAFITYFTYNMGLFIIADHIFTKLEPATGRMIWNFHNSNYIIRNLLLTLALYRLFTIKRIPYEKFGLKENWWEDMPANAKRQKQADNQ